ncbi:uncharacterized protein TNIN_92631 [Trichonephila inaurata madagascariensis]|uniref:Uncharacterized protein n=1 Tax=Trichonephila inaurata madagascariensis TaxID=2747483 RepID=A0A8X6Y0K1_9ARAC|nr:uncharacterized protein TNIN_92631 [Trichonephila inaurata madagascariensis]
MNWMGGARNRVKAKSEKKKQKEFFQAKRQSAVQKAINKETSTIPALSHDLISFHLVERNLKRKIPVSKPTQVIKEDLEKRSSLFDVDYSETPLERNPSFKSKTLPGGWKIKKPTYKSNPIENESGTSKDFQETVLQNDIYTTEKEFQKFLQEKGDDNRNFNLCKPQELNLETNYLVDSPTYSKSQTDYFYPNESPRKNCSLPQDLMRTPDIHESFKKYIHLDKMRQLKNGHRDHYNSDFEYSEAFVNNALQEAFEKKILHRGTTDMDNSTMNRISSKKFKMFKNMNEVLSRHERDKEINLAAKSSQPTLSELSKCTFSSIPTKVSRDCGQILRNNDSEDRHSPFQFDSKSYRHRLNELEKMIRKTNIQRQKIQENSVDFGYSPQSDRSREEYNFSSEFFQSPPDSTPSSSSSGASIPAFFQKKKTHRDHHSINNCDIMSYKKVRRSVIDSNCFDIEVNRKKKIKISNTTVLTPKYSERFNERHAIKYLYDAKSHPTKKIDSIKGDFSKPLFPSSFLHFFPTPTVMRSRKESNIPQDSSSSTEIISEPPVQILNDRKKEDHNDKSSDEMISLNHNYPKNYKISEKPSPYNNTLNCSISLQQDYLRKDKSPHNIKPIVYTTDTATSPFPFFEYIKTEPHLKVPKNNENCENESVFPEDDIPGTPQVTSCSEHVLDNNVPQELNTINIIETNNLAMLHNSTEENTCPIPESERNVIENQLNKIQLPEDSFTENRDNLPQTVPNTPDKYSKYLSKGKMLEDAIIKMQDERNAMNLIKVPLSPAETVPNTPVQIFNRNIIRKNLIQECVSRLASHDTSQERVCEAKEILFPDEGETLKTPSSSQLINDINNKAVQSPSNASRIAITEEMNTSKNMSAFQNKMESNPFMVNISTYMTMTKINPSSPVSSVKKDNVGTPSMKTDNSSEDVENITINNLKSKDISEKAMEILKKNPLTQSTIVNEVNSTDDEKDNVLDNNSKGNVDSDTSESKNIESEIDTAINCTQDKSKMGVLTTVIITAPSNEVSSSDKEKDLNESHLNSTILYSDVAVQATVDMTDSCCQVD